MVAFNLHSALLLAATIALVVCMCKFTGSDMASFEGLDTTAPVARGTSAPARVARRTSAPAGSGPVVPADPMGSNEAYMKVGGESAPYGLTGGKVPVDCFPKDQLNPDELLPGNAATKFAQENPSGGGQLKDKNFLEAGFHVGVNTVGQSLRNANRQLRSEPPNPQVKVSPWLTTTIEPDTNRRPLEIGGCA